MTLHDTLTDTGILRVEASGLAVLNVYVVSNATVTQVTGLLASLPPRASIRFRLKATPVDGKANAALHKMAARVSGCTTMQAGAGTGQHWQHKQLKISHTANAGWAALLVNAGI